MITIQLQNLVFTSFHGIHEEEKILGNQYVVNAEVQFHERDEVIEHIHETVDYSIIYSIIRKRMSIATPLLETIVMEAGNEIHQCLRHAGLHAFPFQHAVGNECGASRNYQLDLAA